MVAVILSDSEFADRYAITSLRGLIYTRTMLLNAASRRGLVRTLGLTRAALAEVFNDDRWMRWRAGQIPARVIEDAVFEALVRKP